MKCAGGNVKNTVGGVNAAFNPATVGIPHREWQTHIITDPIQTQPDNPMESPERPQLQACSLFWTPNNFLKPPWP